MLWFALAYAALLILAWVSGYYLGEIKAWLQRWL
jgi:hypothetical protein